MFNNTEIQAVQAWARTMVQHIEGDRVRDERGEIAQTVIIVAILAAAAIVIATIIATKFTDKANTIPTGG